MGQFKTRILTDFGILSSYSEDWNRLWLANPNRTIFESYSWAKAAWQAYGANRTLFTPVVFDNEQVVGILPLSIENGLLSFIGLPRSDYNNLLCESGRENEVLATCLEAILERSDQWRRCILVNLPEDSSVVKYYSRLPDRLRSRLHLSPGSTCSRLQLDDNRDAILAGILAKQSLRRNEKKLQKRGDVQFRHLVDRGEIRQHLARFYLQHQSRQAMAGERSLFENESNRLFFNELVEQFDPQTELRFSVVEVSEQPVAYHFGFEANGCLVWYKPSFDVDYWDCSPGEVLLKSLIQYVADRGLKTLDFTIGEETFKSRFANQYRRNYNLHVYPETMSGRIGRCGASTKDGFKRKLPRLYSGVKKLAVSVKTANESVTGPVARHGIFGSVGKVISLCRKLLFSRDVVLVYQSSLGELSMPVGDLRLERGSLYGLACLAVDHPDVLNAKSLQKARQQLANGDGLYFGRIGSEIGHVAWTGKRETIRALSDLGPGFNLNLGDSATVIYDCWTPAAWRGRNIYPRMLQMIVRTLADGNRQSWIICRKDNQPSKRGIQKAGFQLRYFMRSVRLLSVTVRRQVVEAGSSARIQFCADVESNGLTAESVIDSRTNADSQLLKRK